MGFLLDLAVIMILAFTAWRGWVKGFVLTLCSLLAVLIAFFGASYVSNQFTEPVAEFIQPYIVNHLEAVLEDLTVKTGDSAPAFNLPSLEDSEKIPEELQATLSEILIAVRSSKTFSRLSETIEKAIQDGSLVLTTSALASVAAFLAHQVTRVVLFFLSFVLILVIWWLFSHMVDLAFHLPVLRTLNEAGGLVLGVAKGFLILLVVCWGLVSFDIVSAELADKTSLFSLFLRFQIL